jgi:hypothetical protein
MKRWRMAAVAAASAVWARGPAAAQEEGAGTDLDSFYGKRIFQEIAVGAAPYLLPGGGMLESVLFGFNTLSRRTQPARHWKNYYGVSLDLGAGQNVPFDFSHYGQADLNLWYGALAIESKLFYSDEGRVRPYLGLNGGFGFGGVTLAGIPERQTPESPSLNLYRFGAEAGVQIMLGERLALVIADITSADFGTLAQDQFLIFPSVIYVGLTSWRGEAEGRNEAW